MNRILAATLVLILALVGCSKPAQVAQALPTYTPYPTYTPLPTQAQPTPTLTIRPTDTPSPTATPQLYTKNAFHYVLLPSDLGQDFYIPECCESDDIQPQPGESLKWPIQGLASTFARNLNQQDTWTQFSEQVWVYDAPPNAVAALAQMSTQISTRFYSDIEELDARLGDSSFAITGKCSYAQDVAGPRFFYHSLVQYANVVIRLEVLAKSLPKAAMTQYQQLAQSKLTEPVPTPTPMATVPIENWVLASKTDIENTVVELLEAKMIPMEQLKSQLRPGAPIDRDGCLALHLKITNNQKDSPIAEVGKLTVIDRKTGYIYPFIEQTLFSNRVAAALSTETGSPSLGWFVVDASETKEFWAYFNVPKTLTDWVLERRCTRYVINKETFEGTYEELPAEYLAISQ